MVATNLIKHMRTLLKSRFYKVKNIRVELQLLKIEEGDTRYIVLERFTGSKYKNEIMRGVFSDYEIARIEFKNVAAGIERLLPVHIPELAY